jgi:hypothetical protein
MFKSLLGHVVLLCHALGQALQRALVAILHEQQHLLLNVDESKI